MSFLQNNKCKESENPTKNESNKPINYLTKNLMKEIECTFEEGNPDNSSVKDETSIYSESTISLEENPEELIFYDDGFQGTIEHRKEEDNSLPLKRSDSIGSTGSLDGEVCFDSVPNSPVLERKTPESGFFSRYFDNAQVDRNFDTSKILGENSDDESIEDENNISEFTEICRECGEMIPIIEIVSHMDYHFALKLSKEESPMKRVMEDEVAGAMSRKRKAVESRKGSIVAFLKKEESNTDVPTEICSECHKRIKLSDLNSHSDYHAAKNCTQN
ncbi:hypothetical protein HHI36_020965 [Cryptolaemus montrouzieri]|uniref:UBZ3-type domain-containing protein n=1 Tax=Cryptolaemus montrouzieri TaxID=559131 RepID=A0ABD2NCE3_9CUCU